MNKNGSCPKNCPDRCIEPINCHTTCAIYLSAKKKREEEKRLIAQKKYIDQLITPHKRYRKY